MEEHFEGPLASTSEEEEEKQCFLLDTDDDPVWFRYGRHVSDTRWRVCEMLQVQTTECVASS